MGLDGSAPEKPTTIVADRGVPKATSALSDTSPATPSLPPASGPDRGMRRVEKAFASRESGFMVTLEARVSKTLRDDDEGSRHQRFLIALANGRTLLVAHNIDLADRIPLERGDRIRLRGQYEWNERGGVLHWTHRDPAGRHAGGWVQFGNRRYE
ncbi:MAG TPA: DUF3465 domain-containing protein [Deltaproteobacteria bacterium]|nr:DUF3465 domain-containing protein [Deltaproteobacteria bacterium]